MFTDDKNAQIVLALLKKYGVKRIVISPGTTNVPIARSVQQDSFFEIYSVVDERGAAYFATGLAFTSGEPVVISCTGATASRNYLSGLTEAYYRHLPVIALTSQHHSATYHDLVPQMTDRTSSQNDIKIFDAILPVVKDLEDQRTCIQLVNQALTMATAKGGGPVHINLPVNPSFSFTTEKLPDVQMIYRHDYENFPIDTLYQELCNKRVAILIGAHRPFSEDCLKAISRFAVAFDAPVFYDHTSCYTGENRILISLASDLNQITNLPELLIDIGSICPDYSASRIFSKVKTWRISEDGIYHNRYGAERLERIFDCSEYFFFNSFAELRGKNNYYHVLTEIISDIQVPRLPLSNTYISYRLSQHIPQNSLLHLGILNSLRNMDFFDVDRTVLTSCNVGGFGIDGALSTIVGQSMASPDKLAFCLLGDLAFFYDMNALGIRHIKQNLRILLINNGRGVEFRLNPRLENQWSTESDDYIAAAGHFGSARAWAESMGFAYLTANSKHVFDKQLSEFCNPKINYFKKPVLFEVFTTVDNEQEGLDRIRSFNRPIRKGEA